MLAQIDRLFWLDLDYLGSSVDKIKEELTATVTDFVGKKSTTISLYEIDHVTNRIGVPRQWGLKHFGNLEREENCCAPDFSWPEFEKPEDFEFWPGQEDSVLKVVTSFQKGSYGSLLEAPCGSGKTLMAMCVAASLNVPTLVLVHKDDLVKQWHDHAKFWPGLNIGHVQRDTLVYEDCHLVIAMAQTIYSRRKKLPQEFFDRFGLVVYDEGHRYPARTFETVMRLFPSRYRLSISATWRRQDKLEFVWHWHVGNVVARTKVPRLSGEYIQIRWMSNLEDRMFKLKWERYPNRQRWVSAICKNIAYNKWLAQQVAVSANVDRRVLVVTDRVEHAKTLRSMLIKEHGVEVGLYIGEQKKDSRKEAKKAQVIVATYSMMAEGTDIPELDTLFLATPRSDVEQIVGRIQRVVEGKKDLLIVDPVFQTGYNVRMAAKRAAVYKKVGFTKRVGVKG